MTHKYLDLASTPAVRAAQRHYYGGSPELGDAPERDSLGDDEREFLSTRDSVYLGSVSETGWPYIQHRGGKPGFLQVLDEHTLGFADFKGNRQLVSAGNLAHNPRVALFAMDYPQRARLKVWGHARVFDAREHPEWLARLAHPDEHARIERLFVIDVVAFDWNCPAYITPRYTRAPIAHATAPLEQRIADLEAQLAAARAR